MKRTATFDIACNDPDNGNFAGRAHMITYKLWDGSYCELEADDWHGYTFTDLGGSIRLHRRKFAIVGVKTWVGNWCWNAYRLERPEAKRFLAALRANGWHCTHGPCTWYNWFNKTEEEQEAQAKWEGKYHLA